MADGFQATASTVTVREIAPGPITTLRLRLPTADDLARIGTLIGTPLTTVPNRASDGAVRVIWIGLDEWLILGDTAPHAALEAAARDAAAALSVGVGDGRCVFEVTGPGAADLINKASSLDLNRVLATPEQTAMTLFAQVNVVIDRPPGLDGYRLIFDISIRDYLHRWFRDAVVEFG
ncbi:MULTISPECIES: sarcosine oxidase subunit gamma [unclassified Sphingomonas]|uniref:sarcosine oxidase subunit gamma n=1 Tax=unclassified Sphingomonas TaxID=196159 RepID=UPI0006FBD9D0|nr:MULTISPECIES: sarcosine oxidase subunit gamma family protein [unclassified Sphingomonas]KQX22624.1 sarcosine oxidase subunit gamma [Sphingomonas sp. Root1294]KQY67898.1 sarcosine oxidase subunit gamma [Sphingomonas sp. Root50]KRB88823.1 sarcosine oxidase subunit gamma [Sphingomonas sp. Root720]